MPSPATELIVALDVDTLDEAREIVRRLGPQGVWYKVGKQLFTRHGPDSVRFLKDAGKKVFLDLKFHDIPNTVAQAVRAAGAIGADLTNVHASGGPAMLTAAAQAAAEARVMLVAVTVLTSLGNNDLQAIGFPPDTAGQALRLAGLAKAAGCQGVVCSAHEIAAMRAACGSDFALVVPGIRPAGSAHDDQKRVMTPAAAAAAGARFIVVGRPVTQAADPPAAAAAIRADLAG
ncbi:MAG: orotidine-5'-phosphate decarboxylase [Lentisphaeria bacterium]